MKNIYKKSKRSPELVRSKKGKKNVDNGKKEKKKMALKITWSGMSPMTLLEVVRDILYSS